MVVFSLFIFSGCHVVDHTRPEVLGQRPGSRPRPRPISTAALEFCMSDLKNELVLTQTKYLAARPLYERIISQPENPQLRYHTRYWAGKKPNSLLNTF